MVTRCLFCGGDSSEPDHWQHCDGRQGTVEELDDAITMQARHSDPETSRAAMAAYDEDRMRSAMAMAIWLHQDRGPMADFRRPPRRCTRTTTTARRCRSTRSSRRTHPRRSTRFALEREPAHRRTVQPTLFD